MLVWYLVGFPLQTNVLVLFLVFLWLHICILSELNSVPVLIRTQVKFCDVLHCFYLKLICIFQELGFFFSPPSKLFFLIAFTSVCRLFRTALFTKIMSFLSTRLQYFTCQSKTTVLQTSYHLKFRFSLNPWIFSAIFVSNCAVQKRFQHMHAIHKSFRTCWKGNIHVCFFQSRGDGYL